MFPLLGEQIYSIGYCPIDKESEVPKSIRFNELIRKDAIGLPYTEVNVKAALDYFKILSGGPTKASTLASQLEQKEYSDHTTSHTMFSSRGTNLQVSWVNSQTHEVVSAITRKEYL